MWLDLFLGELDVDVPTFPEYTSMFSTTSISLQAQINKDITNGPNDVFLTHSICTCNHTLNTFLYIMQISDKIQDYNIIPFLNT